MKARILGFFFLFITANQLLAQVGNEWIDYSQTYYKISVARDGIYRVTGSDLLSAGVPAGVDPALVKLFHRGIEQAITVDAGADGKLDGSDYIEFYGQKNDGTLDAKLYQPESVQPHKYYNLYSDTTAYFLAIEGMPGKRMAQTNEAPGSLVPSAFHTAEVLLVNTMQYYTGRDENEVQLTRFDIGEGWTGYQMLQTQSRDYSVSTISNGYAAAGKPKIDILVQGWGPMVHVGEVLLGTGLRSTGTFTFTGFESFVVQVEAEWSDVAADGTLAVRVQCIGAAGSPDRFSVSYIKVRFPQSLDMQNASQKVFELSGNGSKSLVNINNAPGGVRLFDVTDPNNISAIASTVSTTLNAALDTKSNTRILAAKDFITPSVRAVTFREIIPSQYNYIIVSHPQLRTPALGYSDPVSAYADYRNSPEGGGYKAIAVNVQELYDGFNYGEYSPLAIYQFMRHMTAGGKPQYLLLAGKGLEVFYSWNRVQATKPYGIYQDFIPSAGYPSSDMAYSVGLSGTTYEPAVATGRIPALKSADIASYLNKVKEMEAQSYNALWRKNVMHLSGGIYDGEPQLFKSYMLDFQTVAEGAQLGGKVSALAKHSKEVQSINIAGQVNEGLNLVTFFGHASPTLLDFQLGNATDPVEGYNNKGKYPTLLMNGCQVGDFNLVATLFGEDWITAKDKGAIGFIGHSGYGFVSNLRKYTQLFYEVGYGDAHFVNRGLGDIQREVARRFMENDGAWMASISQVQQMMLLGDPAVKLFGADKSDLEITDSGVSVASFDGKPITMQSDSFAVRMVVKNYGLAPNTTVRIEVLRTLSDNTTISYDSLYPVTRYSDTLLMVIRKKPWDTKGFGDNTFRVTIDPDNIIEEYSKTNNVAGKTLAIVSNGTRNLFPTDFSIVNSADISLSFQTYDVLSGEREFVVQIDTTYDFSSTYVKEFTVKGAALARKAVQLLEGDTITYYWRTRLATPGPGESTGWESSSFTYINKGKSGWAQVRFPQFFEDSKVGLVQDSALQQIRFLERVQPVSLRAASSQVSGYYDTTSIRIGGVEYFHSFPDFACRGNTINLVAFDRKSAFPYLGVKLEWFNSGGRACGRESVIINSYAYNELVTDRLTDLIGYVNNIPVGDSVVLFNIGNALYSYWPAEAIIKLGELGISEAQITSLEDDEPVIIFGRKGDAPGTAVVHRSTETQHNRQTVEVSRTITGGYSTGSISSDRIGPALSWDGLHAQALKTDDGDVVSFNVTGVKPNGEEELVISDIASDRDLSEIDAAAYPYLRLSFNTSDDTYITTAQLKQWLVTYIPGPEGMLYYNGTRDLEKIEEGIAWRGEFGFVNIGDQSFSDSLSVAYEVFNQRKLLTIKSTLKVKAPAPGDTTFIPIDVNTLGLAGTNDFQIFINPRVIPEQYYSNNLLLLTDKFEVTEDGLNPLIDVTIDGRRVTNGDYVSSDPAILVRLWDENKNVLKTDTTGVRMFLTYPCDQPACAPTQILLSDSRVKWYPATTSSVFRVEFHPDGLADGVYSLRVEGADAKGNGSTLTPYEVSFVVLNETTLTVSDLYPNPTKSDVYFKVVVSGNQAPDHLQLRVTAANGQVQEIFTEADFEALHIGSNELIWSAKTRNGNPLPNGIYIYQLTVGVNDTYVRRVGKIAVMK
ncbi:C25 family cysteine peptidase [Chryseolinea sp. T2]|uniref:putative type IX secretion system sortase PorU2 n=1 Tax=Chryseolinea sp. T2 TaxID=3129255 RepID=UPI0030782FF3